MKRNPGKLQCETSSSGKQTSSSSKEPNSSSSPNDVKPNEKGKEDLKLNKQGSSGGKKHSKHLDRSPTKKSREHLKQISGDEEDDNVPVPGIKKFTKDINDVGSARLPHIPDHEVQKFMIAEDLSEIERIKVLLKKETQDQKSYLFNNIENIFLIDKGLYHNIYGNEYDQEKYKRKQMRYNYETQPHFGSESLDKTPDSKLKETGTIEICVDDDDDEDNDIKFQNSQNIVSTFQDNIDVDEDIKEQQDHIQEQIFPLIFGTWIQGQEEYIQILAGEAFLILLKEPKFTYKGEFLIKLKDESLKMLSQWSADIIEIWIEVYAISLSQIIKRKKEFEESQIDAYREQCRQTVQKMIDRNQMIKVRIKAASLLGLMAQHNSLGDVDLYQALVLVKLRPVCQDLHWEVRKDMCGSLIHISRYIGKQKSFQYVLPELKELLDDEEGEVVTEAIVSFQKHLDHIYDDDFIEQPETMEMFTKLCELTVESTMCLVDLAVVLKKLGKYILTFNRPDDEEFFDCIIKIVNKATREQDEEVRAMIPVFFKPFCDVYAKNSSQIIEFYDKNLKKFISSQIKLGNNQEQDNPMFKLPKSFHSEILGKDNKKYNYPIFADDNYEVNRSIAQNLHYFFGAFLQIYQNYKSLDRKGIEQLNQCVQQILEDYKLLIQTKDRDLLHHVVFSFKNYHEIITKIDIWFKLPEPITILYQEILSTELKATIQIQKNSWRYLITSIKALETVICSNFEYNEQKTREMISDQAEKDRITVNNQIIAFDLLIQSERKDAIKIMESLLVDKSVSKPVKQYIIKILSREMLTNKQSKIRQTIQDYVIKLSKVKSFSNKKIYIELIQYMVTEQIISSRMFQKIYFDSMITLLDTLTIPSFQLMISQQLLPKIYKLIMYKPNQVDKLKHTTNFIKLKYIQSLQANADERDKKTKQQLVQYLDQFQSIIESRDFQNEARQYLATVDKKLLKIEQELDGTTEEGERTQSLLNLEKNMIKQKKAISVRSGSKQGQRVQGVQGKQDPVDVMNKMDTGRKRIKSLRPPSQGFQRRTSNQMALNKNQENFYSGENKLNGNRKVNKNKYASNQGVNIRNELPSLFEECNENQIDQNNPFIIMQNEVQYQAQKHQFKLTPMSKGDSNQSQNSNPNDPMLRHSDKLFKGKTQVLISEPSLSKANQACKDYINMLPPKAKGSKFKQYVQISNQNSQLEQYRSQQLESFNQAREEEDKLQINSSIFEKQRNSQKQRTSENNKMSDITNNSNLHLVSALNQVIDDNQPGIKQSNNSIYANQQYAANNNYQRMSNFVNQTPNQYQRQVNNNLKNQFIKVEHSNNQPGDLEQISPVITQQQTITIDSTTSSLMKNNKNNLLNQNRNSNYRVRNNNKYSISEEINEICANSPNELQGQDYNSGGNNINKIYARAAGSISPQNSKINQILSSIPSIPNIPKIPVQAPLTQEMRRKSSQGFIQYKRQNSKQKLQTPNKPTTTQLPDVRISRKSNMGQFNSDKPKLQIFDQNPPSISPSNQNFMEQHQLFGKKIMLSKNKKY